GRFPVVSRSSDLIQEPPSNSDAVFCLQNRADGTVHQRGDPAEGGDKEIFFPHLPQDLIAFLRLHLSAGQRLFQPPDPWAVLTVSFTEDQIMAGAVLLNLAPIVQCRFNKAKTAQDLLG